MAGAYIYNRRLRRLRQGDQKCSAMLLLHGDFEVKLDHMRLCPKATAAENPKFMWYTDRACRLFSDIFGITLTCKNFEEFIESESNPVVLATTLFHLHSSSTYTDFMT